MLTTPQALKSVKELTNSQNTEQKATTMATAIKQTMHQNPKSSATLPENANNELRQKLEQLLLSNPTLKTDLNLKEQRFYYKALNRHLTNQQIESKSSEEMLVFLGNKIKASKKTEPNSEHLSYEDDSSLDKLNHACNYDTDESYRSDPMESIQENTERPIYPLPPEICKLHSTSKPQKVIQSSQFQEEITPTNALNESTSQSSEEEQLSKTNLSSETHEQEQPIYIFPPNIDYPEDDLHEFYYPSDFPKHSHLQIVCSYFRLGPPYGLLTASLEHYEHQKDYFDQRPLENNLKNNPHFMSLLTRYGDYYLDYDLQDPDNKASKQYLFINPHTKRISKRRSAATRGYH